jgi:hypothetical protein
VFLLKYEALFIVLSNLKVPGAIFAEMLDRGTRNGIQARNPKRSLDTERTKPQIKQFTLRLSDAATGTYSAVKR